MTRTMRSPRLLRNDSAGAGPARPVPSRPHAACPDPWPGAHGTGAHAIGPHGTAPDGPGLVRGGAPTGPGLAPPGTATTGAAPAARPAGNALPAPAGPSSGPTAAADAVAGDPVPRRLSGIPADPLAPPRQRASGTAAGELRVVPDPQPAPAPGPRPAPPDTPVDGGAEPGPWALVRDAQAGDMGAFSELFDRYYDIVFRYVLFRMNDRTLAEDITQETFLRALRRITSVTYQGRDIGAWFVTIARNLIFDHVKSSRYRLESTTSDIVELSPSTHGPEQQVLELATNEELLRCVRKLNADQQECISLRFLQGLSVAETATIMNRNEGAVKALQHRAVRRLAQLLPEGLR
jgi:RNA polymerase sigma-70 factor (ECF subfamily)